MGKQYTADPNPGNESSIPKAIEGLHYGVADVRNQLQHLVGQTCEVNQELNHIDAGISDLNESLLLVAAALVDQTDSPSGLFLKEAVKKKLRSLSD